MNAKYTKQMGYARHDDIKCCWNCIHKEMSEECDAAVYCSHELLAEAEPYDNEVSPLGICNYFEDYRAKSQEQILRDIANRAKHL